MLRQLYASGFAMKRLLSCYLLSLVILFCGVGCIGTRSLRQSGFLVSYASLISDPAEGGIYRYDNPKVRPERILRQYSEVMLESTVVYFHPEAFGRGVDPNELKELTDYFHQGLTAALAEHLSVVNVPGPEVLRIRTAIVDALPILPRLSPHPALTTISLEGASLEVEILDAKTSERIAAMLDARNREGILKIEETRIEAQSKAIINEWISLIKEKLDRLYGK